MDPAALVAAYRTATADIEIHRAAMAAATARRCLALYRLHALGYSYVRIGEALHLSSQRVGQLVNTGRTLAGDRKKPPPPLDKLQ